MDDTRGDARPSSAEEAWALLLKLQESGSAPDFETWVREYPEFEAELRRLHEEWAQVDDQLEQAFAGPSGPDSPFLSSLAEAQAAGEVDVAPEELRPGLRVGEFRLLRRIAEGGMGQVWEAEQAALRRRVALKFIRPDRVDQRAVDLFEREARAGGRVNDPRIVTVHATGETGGLRWIAQEHVEEERTLLDWLAEAREQPRLTPAWYRRVAAFFADAAEAMASAHAVGVIHRDLKPQNILVAPDGRPKITDFGLARLQDESSLSGEISVAGTTRYMSPEQVAGKLLGIDERTDVFSLGAVLYELLTLERPFDGDTPVEIFGRITLHDPKPPREVRPEVPVELGVIATKALEKRPRDRYAGMAELAADLRRWLAHEPIHARPPGPLQRAAKWCRRHPTATVAATLLLVAGAVMGVVLGRLAAGALELRKREYSTRVLWAIDDGRMQRAEQLAGELLDLDPTDSRAHLLLAMGYSRYLRMREAQASLDAASALGFEPEGPVGDDPEEMYLRALYLVAKRDRASEQRAAELLQGAIDSAGEDPFDHAWFPLYQVRKSLGDTDGAVAALSAFQATLEQGATDQNHVVEALMADLQEDHARAIEELEALRSEVPDDRMVELRAHRHLGRNYLLRFLQTGRTDLDLLERAEGDLLRAVEALDDDAGAWACLGLVDLLRADAEDDPGPRADLISSAEQRAREGLGHYSSSVMAEEVLVDAARMRVTADGFQHDDQDELQLEELERRLEDLEALEADSTTARSARSDLYYFRGAIARDRDGDMLRAMDLFEQSSQAYEGQLRARVLLAQRLHMGPKDYEASLEWFLEARDVWEAGIPTMYLGDRKPWERFWGFALQVWIFGTADLAGQPELAAEARDRALEWLDAGDEVKENELLSFAEFLATPAHLELQDCERAREILEGHDLEAHYRRLGLAAAFEIIDKIRDACPD